MKMQIRAQSFKSHPKVQNPPRSYQSAHLDVHGPLNERPLLNSIKQINTNHSGSIGSGKVKLQRPQEYLIRKQASLKDYESEIQKLTQICEQFYRENQRLKQYIREQQEKSDQIWSRRVNTLENELRKHRQILDSKNSIILSMQGPQRKSLPNQSAIFASSPYKNSHIMMQNNDNSKVEKQIQQLDRREKELMKYMHKQTQFIQIYVNKQKLEEQIRNLESVVAAQAKQLDEVKRSYVKLESKFRHNQQTTVNQSQLQLEKIKVYNQKLLQMLSISSNQIERLNNILKLKLQQNQKNKVTIKTQQQEIILIKDSQSKQSNTLKNNQQQKQIISQLQFNIAQLRKQNIQLKTRLDDQVNLSLQLRNTIQKQEEQQNQYKSICQQFAEVQTDTQQTQVPALIEGYQRQIKSMKEQNSELTKFIIQQNTQSNNSNDQIKRLKRKIDELEAQLAMLKGNQEKIPLLINRLQHAEQKLVKVSNQHQVLFNQVQSSCTETQTVQRQIQQMLQQKLQILSQYQPTKAQSEMNFSSGIEANRLLSNGDERFNRNLSSKSQSQAELHHKE